MQNGITAGVEAASSTAAVVPKVEGAVMNDIGERLVSVRAQVMTYDDRFCGWLPLDGGGVSNITLYQRVGNGGESNGSVGHDYDPTSSAPSTSAPKYEYVIHGERVEDCRVNLHCQLTKDVNYRQVMPTFHHWQIDERKFGLKFMSSYEACKFHNRLQKAVEHLYRQSKSSSGESNVETEDLEDDVFVPVDLPLSRAESWESGKTSRSVPAGAASGAIVGPSTSLLRTSFPCYSSTTVPAIVHQPTSTTSAGKKKKKSTASASTVAMPPTDRSLSSGRPPGRTPTWPKTPAELTLSAGTAAAATTSGAGPTNYYYPYVYFQKETSTATAYTRPPYQTQKSSKHGLQASASFGQLTPYPARTISIGRSSALEKRESVSSLKLSLIHQQIALPSASSSGGASLRYGGSRKTTKSGVGGASPLELLRRERCFYCKSYYVERDNRRGACPDAPDSCSKWLRRLTCIWCAECVLYCCCREWTDGEAPRDADVCSCSPADPTRRQRWALLTFLALLVPCLWCYPPLSACHRSCRRRCQLLGGRHAPTGPGGLPSHHSIVSGAGRSSSVGRMSMTPEPSAVYK